MTRTISVIGLGYVGLPVAVAFDRAYSVVGFDTNPDRVRALERGHDTTLEVSDGDLAASDIIFTSDAAVLRRADFHIVAVPTPINESNQPDLKPLLGATETVGGQLKRGDIVVFESTVYPGATEEDCVPILEVESGLKAGVDFTVGYSPERINPGDKTHTFTQITKVVSGQDARTLDIIAEVYGSVVEAGVHKASSIKVAEAAKVIENTQRDLNIALMNELAIIFRRMGIDTLDVLAAAGTKWNFLPFTPGLVGGHCIGVDPYYLTHKAQKVGYHPEVILAGRRTNDSMGRYIVAEAVKAMVLAGMAVKGSRVGVLGVAFKEDCPDLRNSRVMDILAELDSYQIEVLAHDPLVSRQETLDDYAVVLYDWEQLVELDAVIIATAHSPFKSLTPEAIQQTLKPGGIVFDVKGVLDREICARAQLPLWRL